MKVKKILMANLIIVMISLVFTSSISALTISSVVLKNEIQPGKTTTITIGLKNDGNEDISDVSVALDLNQLPFAPYNSASEHSIEKIREDDTKFAEFNIIANNAKAGIYKIPIVLSYTENETLKKKNALISLIVNSKPEIEVSIEDDLILKGRDSEFVIRVTNKGLSDAKFVEVEIGKGKYDLLVNNNQYIGDIGSDDFDSVKLKIFIRKDVGNSIKFPVTVIYKDDLNKEYRETLNLFLNVYDENEAIKLGLIEKNNSFSYIIGIVITLILYLVYRNLKKKSKR